MSDKMRWRYADTNPVIAAVDRDTVIEIGDILWQERDDARPACWLASQQELKANFLGVAMQRSRIGDTSPIRVATTGVFEFDCDGTHFELGNMIAAKIGPGQLCLCNQSVVKTSRKHEAIGRVAKRGDGNIVLVAIQSTVMGPL
jgi:hypothetical protein